jgi:two-component system response regulator YesN
MIVDDEYPIRKGIANCIDWAQIGFTVSGLAEDGREALELIERQRPDVLVTDIRMPVMDGLELLKHVNALYPGIITVVLSGYGEFEYAQKAIEAGVSSYILKPIKEESLTALFKKFKLELDINSQSAVNKSMSGSDRFEELKEHYLIKLVSGGFNGASETMAKLSATEIKLNSKHMCGVIMSFKPEYSMNDFKSVFKDFSFQSENSRYHAYNNRLLYLIFDSCHSMSVFNVLKETRKIKLGIEERTGAVVSCGIGGLFSGFEKLSASFNEAMDALRLSFYKGSGTIIQYNEIKSLLSADTDRNKIKAAVEEISQTILQGNTSMIKPKIKLLFAQILSNGYLNKNKLIVKCIEIYMAIILKVEQSKLPVKISGEDDLYSLLSSSESMDELSHHYENILLNITEQIKELKSSNNNSLSMKIMQYIKENYHKKLVLKDIADVFSLNSTYLSSYFKENTGENLFDFIMKVRIKNAKALLRESNMQITEISEKIGFQGYRHFCTAFKKETGMTPLQYRLKFFI